MEINLLTRQNIPADAIFSVRAGSVRKQMKAHGQRSLRFSNLGHDENPLKIDLLQQIGSAFLVLKPGGEQYKVVFQSPGEVAPMSCEVEVTKAQCESPKGDAGVAAEPFTSAKKKAKAYLEMHKILQCLQAVVQEVIVDRPQNPYSYIAEYFMALEATTVAAKGDATSTLEGHGEASEYPVVANLGESDKLDRNTGDADVDTAFAKHPNSQAIKRSASELEQDGTHQADTAAPLDVAAELPAAAKTAATAVGETLILNDAAVAIRPAAKAHTDNITPSTPHGDDADVDTAIAEHPNNQATKRSASELEQDGSHQAVIAAPLEVAAGLPAATKATATAVGETSILNDAAVALYSAANTHIDDIAPTTPQGGVGVRVALPCTPEKRKEGKNATEKEFVSAVDEGESEVKTTGGSQHVQRHPQRSESWIVVRSDPQFYDRRRH